jgi:hypothetical protein
MRGECGVSGWPYGGWGRGWETGLGAVNCPIRPSSGHLHLTSEADPEVRKRQAGSEPASPKES